MRARFLVVFVTLLLFPAVAPAAGPEGWRLQGNDPSSYLMDRDSVETYAGRPSGRLMSVCVSDTSDSTMRCRGFGTMMQCIEATDYAKHRIRFSGYVKARDVRGWAGLWMRVDGEGDQWNSLAFDNMKDRPITGTREWTRYEIVLNVRRDAAKICFGILLHGQGTVWLSGANLETVSTAVPTTGEACK
jgi:hypothetical protein